MVRGPFLNEPGEGAAADAVRDDRIDVVRLQAQRVGCHTLKLYEERLTDLATKRSELEKLVAAKRQDLMAKRTETLQSKAQQDPKVRKQMDEASAAYQTYLSEDPVLPAFNENGRSEDIAPPEPVQFGALYG